MNSWRCALCFPATPSTHLFSLSLLFFQIHIIDFDDENNIINKNVLLHQAGEIWHIAASPADKAVLSTCYNKSKFYFFLLSLVLFCLFMFLSSVTLLHLLHPLFFVFIPCLLSVVIFNDWYVITRRSFQV